MQQIIDIRNTCEAHFCNVIYPKVTALMATLCARHLAGEKIIKADGCSFTKKAAAEVAEVVEGCKAPRFRLFLKVQTVGAGVFSSIDIAASCDYTAPMVHGDGCRYVTCYIPTIYLTAESLKNYADIKPPIFEEITPEAVQHAKETLRTVKAQIAALEDTASRCKHILSEVGL